jgi:hypothetical protein
VLKGCVERVCDQWNLATFSVERVRDQWKGVDSVASLFYNSTRVSTITLPSDRVSGANAELFISSPWYTPARAIIAKVSLQSLQ